MKDPQTTSGQEKFFAQRAQTESSKKSNHNVRRQYSKSHGDLSKLRPKSPPIGVIPVESSSLRLPHDSDTQNLCSPTSNRQCRQALPIHWMTAQNIDPSNQTSRSAEMASYEALPPPHNLTTGHDWQVPTAIHGLSTGNSGPIDFCKPFVRNYPTALPDKGRVTRTPMIQQVTVKTEWMFSEFEVAVELSRIHQVFTVTLERMLASEIWKTYLHDCVPHNIKHESCVRGISFCRDQLVGDMADALYSTPEDMGVRARLGLLRLYLAASDCLTQYDGSLSRDTSITVRIDHDWRSETLSPIVQAAWVPDSVTFRDLDAIHSLREGQELSIIPQYQCNSAFGSTRYPSTVNYKIESQSTPLSWLLWDDRIGGFKGIIPTYSALQRNDYRQSFLSPLSCLCIDVLATVSYENGSSVSYERTVCTRLAFDLHLEGHSSGSICRQSMKLDAANHGPSAHEIYNVKSSREQFKVDTHMLSNVNHSFGPYLSVNERPDFVLSTDKSELGLKGAPDVAQQHAYLAARYASMSQRHADAEKHIRTLNSCKYPHTAQAQPRIPNVQYLYALDHNNPPSTSRRPMVQESAGNPSVHFDVHERLLRDEYASHHNTNHSAVPRSHGLPGRTVIQAQTFNPRNGVHHSALPPPAIRAVSSQHVEDLKEASIPQSLPLGAYSHQACRSENNASHVVRPHQRYPTPITPYSILNVDFQRGWGFVENNRGYPGLAGTMKRAPHPVKVDEAAANSLSEPSRGDYSPLQLSRDDDDGHAITTLEYGLASDSYYRPPWSGVEAIVHSDVVGEGPHSTMPNLVGRSGLNNSVLVQGLPSSSDSSTRPVHRSDLEYITVKAGPPEPLPYRLPALSGALTPPHSLEGKSCAASENEEGEKTIWSWKSTHEASRDAYSPYETFYPCERPVAVRSSQASSVISHSASSKLELTVNDHYEAIPRRQQALAWHRLKSDAGDGKDKPNIGGVHIRLSEDEKKAMEEAIERSLDDIVEDFDGIFINSSDGSACEDDVEATDEP